MENGLSGGHRGNRKEVIVMTVARDVGSSLTYTMRIRSTTT